MKFAGMAELADAHGLGPCALKACRFKSCSRHHRKILKEHSNRFGRVGHGRLYPRNQPRTYLLNQSIVRCQARSAAALLYRSGVASQLKPCTAPG